MITNTLKNGPDNVYLNISMVHDSSYGSNPSPSSYIANKTQPLLNNAQDYYMAIIQFTIPLNQCPILICPVNTTLGNSNTTPLKVGIRDFSTGIYYERPLIWTPELINESVVVQNGGTQVITPYYYMYQYETLINMLNTALTLAFNDYNAMNVANPHFTHPCPFFVYDATTKLISLIAHQSWITATPLTQAIYVNNEMYNFLDSLPVKVYSNLVNPTVKDNVFTIKYNGINSYPTNTYPTVGTYIQMIQEYDQTYLWNSLRKVIITSGSLPVNKEQTPLFNNFNNDLSNSIPIIADFIVGSTSAGDSREIAYYSTTTYRLIDINSNLPLTKLQFEIFWLTTNNEIIPLQISNSQAITLKLGFFKKSLYNNI